MAQADGVVANGTGAAVRSDLNGQLAALFTNHSGSSEPGTTYAYQWWADTNANVLKIRNSANDGWITLRELDGTMLIEDGSGANPGLAFASDTNSGIFGGSDVVGFTTGGTQRFKLTSTSAVFNEVSNDYDFRVESNGNTHMLFVDAGNDRVGVGESSPITTLHVNAGTTDLAGIVESSDANVFFAFKDGNSSGNQQVQIGAVTNDLVAYSGGSESLRVDSSGRLLVGTSTASSAGNASVALLEVSGNTNGATGSSVISIKRGEGAASMSNGDTLGRLIFTGLTGGDFAYIQGSVDGSPSGSDFPGRLMFFTTADGSSSPTERMRISNNGFIGLQGAASSGGVTSGKKFYIQNDGHVHIAVDDTTPVFLNRNSSDGNLIVFRQANNQEGTISVSGTTVTYGGGHLARWSQLAGGAERIEILRGSVLSNLDEMCEWAYEAQDAVLYTEEDELPEGVSVGDVKTPAVAAGTEDNEQLNRMKVSDAEGDANVSGVFVRWDDDDDTYTNDFFCAMTGDFVIRIAQGTTVARGDLLMSAGDGTAKPQGDDIVRSKTIAKVTSTTVSTTYSDGSYCVPCVLMAC